MDIVILIDCWAGYMGPTDLRSKMCENIKQNINTIDPDLVVFATYEEELHPTLKNSVFHNTTNALSLDDFKLAIDKLDLPTTIDCWFFGLHWNSCVRDNPLGWKSIYNFFRQQKQDVVLWSRKDCTLKIPFKLSDNLEVWPDFENDDITKLSHVFNGNWIIHPEFQDNQS